MVWGLIWFCFGSVWLRLGLLSKAFSWGGGGVVAVMFVTQNVGRPMSMSLKIQLLGASKADVIRKSNRFVVDCDRARRRGGRKGNLGNLVCPSLGGGSHLSSP